MKVKAVIFNNDRTTTVKILKKAERAMSKFTVTEKDYYIDPDAYVSTYAKVLRLFKVYYFTLYYRENDPAPLPAPEFAQLDTHDRNGITGAELNQIFKPVFYRILAMANKNPRLDFVFYLCIANVLLALFTAWQVKGISDTLGAFLDAYNQAAVQAAQPETLPPPPPRAS